MSLNIEDCDPLPFGPVLWNTQDRAGTTPIKPHLAQRLAEQHPQGFTANEKGQLSYNPSVRVVTKWRDQQSHEFQLDDVVQDIGTGTLCRIVHITRHGVFGSVSYHARPIGRPDSDGLSCAYVGFDDSFRLVGRNSALFPK